MNFIHRLSRLLPAGWRRGARARHQLTEAYTRVFFSGGASKQDAQLVLVDLANFSGFYRVNGPGIDPNDRAFADGMRAVYGRLQRHLRLTDDEVRQLEEAARHEAIVDAQEGSL